MNKTQMVYIILGAVLLLAVLAVCEAWVLILVVLVGW